MASCNSDRCLLDREVRDVPDWDLQLIEASVAAAEYAADYAELIQLFQRPTCHSPGMGVNCIVCQSANKTIFVHGIMWHFDNVLEAWIQE